MPLSHSPLRTGLPREGERWRFVGDSITYDGRWIALTECVLRTRGIDVDFVNLGLPSETVSGLSEPAHPFPRPCLHERLARVLELAAPDVLVVAYGMNDGIYNPPHPERTAAFEAGMARVVREAMRAGARLVVVGASLFDPLPLGDRLIADPAAASCSWERPWADYNDVLRAYSEYQARLAAQHGLPFVDVQGALSSLIMTRRDREPGYTCCPDGIHPDLTGHTAIAAAFLAALDGGGARATGLSKLADLANAPDRLLKLVQERQDLLRDAWLSHVGHHRPDLPIGHPLAVAMREAERLRASLIAPVPRAR